MYEAILLDIDGTLVNRDGNITPRTREALLAAQEQGARLVLASGRGYQGLTPWTRELRLHEHGGVLVCFNGAQSINFQTGEVYYERALTPEQGKRVLRHMQNFDVAPVLDHGERMYVRDCFFTVSHNGGPFYVIEYEAHSNGYLLTEVDDLVDTMEWPIHKILTAGEPDYLESHWREMAEPFEDELSSMFTAPFYYEFMAKGVDKSEALARTLDRLDVDRSRVMAFGDAQNDVGMLRLAGYGVAMGNAVDEVKAVADEVTLSNEEDGIAHVVERLVLGA